MYKKMADQGGEIALALNLVRQSIQKAINARPKNLPQVNTRLVAVSKTKPVSDILEAYRHGQRNFGENYVQELEEKSRDQQIREQCGDIQWHFIGHLQRNKASKLACMGSAVPNLYMVETIDNHKIAQTLNSLWEKYKQPGRLKVMVQVNTSQELNKSGCNQENVCSLVTFIRDKCPHLEFTGVMTIGAVDYNPLNTGSNPDFCALIKCREDLCKSLNMGLEEVEVSMGMSSDYEHAIQLGSTNVRIGSTIFGTRNYTGQQTNAIAESASTEVESRLSENHKTNPSHMLPTEESASSESIQTPVQTPFSDSTKFPFVKT